MGTLNSWNIVDANNNATPPDGWPENTMQYSEVNDTGRAVQGTLKRYFADINGSLVAGGVADAYTVSLNEIGYTAYFTGMYFACEINADNTGPTTIDVNGIGPQNVVTPDGSALGADTLKSGGIYEFRYDGTNFQLGGSVGGASVTVSQIILSNTNDPDLVDTDVALNVGSDDPDNNQHIEIGPSDVQSKSDATTAAVLGLNALGGNVEVGAQSGSGNVTLYENGELSLRSNIAGIFVFGSVATATPPTTEAVNSRLLMFDNDGSDELLFFGFPASPDFLFTNRMHGGTINIRAEDSAGNEDVLFIGDPDGAVDLYHAGTRQFGTQSSGINVYGSAALPTPPVGAATTTLILWDSDGSDALGTIGFAVSSALTIANDIHGGAISLQAEDAGGVNRFLANGNPDGAFDTYYQGVLVTGTLPAANGGLQVNNTLTGGGFERVLTTSDALGAASRGAMAYHNTTQVIGATTSAYIALNSEVYDTDSIHDNITNNTRLTVPAGVTRVRLSGGVYRGTGGSLLGSVQFNKNNSNNFIGFAQQGSEPPSGGTGDEGISVHTGVLSVIGGDYFELRFNNWDSASATLSANRTWASMEIIA